MREETKTLIELLRKVEDFALTFSAGKAYLPVRWVEKQELLRLEIAAAIEAAEKADPAS